VGRQEEALPLEVGQQQLQLLGPLNLPQVRPLSSLPVLLAAYLLIPAIGSNAVAFGGANIIHVRFQCFVILVNWLLLLF
jgi:hypothetical protein